MEKKLKPSSLILLLILFFAFTACTTTAPRILQLYHQLDVVMDRDSGEQHEELSFFLMVEDDDGIKDIDELILTHPEAELQWKLSASEWRAIERSGENWIGGTGFRSPEEMPLPRGRYLVEVTDKAGERAQSEFILPGDLRGLRDGPIDEDLFPRFYDNGRSGIRPGGQVSVLLTGPEGRFLRSETLDDGVLESGTLDQWKKEGAGSFRLHRYLDDRGFGLVGGPFPIP